MMMTDGAGSVVWSGEYLPFGEALSITGSVTNNLRFPGQYYDSETGLHQNGFRDYKPEIGRYPQADPIGLLGGINLYSYVGNSPVNFVDPEGKAIIAVGICIGAMTLDVASTIYDLNKYAEEMAEIKSEIETAKKTCSSDEEYINKTMELQKRMLQKSHEIAKRRLEGIAYGIPIAFFCVAAPFLPF
jgi:RHS repeat-associated protein